MSSENGKRLSRTVHPCLSMLVRLTLAGICTLHTQDRVGSSHQSRHRDGLTAVTAAAKIGLI